jgi:hypothetical protein
MKVDKMSEATVIVGKLSEKVPLPAIVAAYTALVSYAATVGAPFIMIAGPEIHIMLVDPEPVLVQARTTRVCEIFKFWGMEPTVMDGEAAVKHVETLTKD